MSRSACARAVTAALFTTGTLAAGIGIATPAGAVGTPPSSTCDTGVQVVDNTAEGVRTKLYAVNQSPTEVDVCFLVAGFGGVLVVTPTMPGATLGPVQLPSQDGNLAACQLGGNLVPGTHPAVQGGAGGVPYLLDAYASGSSVSVCVQLGVTTARLLVPVAVPSPTVTPGTQVAFFPDPGTP